MLAAADDRTLAEPQPVVHSERLASAGGTVTMSLCVFFSSRRRHTRYWRDWSSDVCSSDLSSSDGAGRLARLRGFCVAGPGAAESAGFAFADPARRFARVDSRGVSAAALRLI